MLKLNLASGTDLREGWVNLDIVPRWPNTKRGCDVIWDARKDKIPFPDNSAEEIYAGYLLLHIAPIYHKPVLAEIHRVLSPSGDLLFREVDMEVVFPMFLQKPNDVRLAELIWGEQGQPGSARPGEGWNEHAEFDKHCHGFTRATLTRLLEETGFTSFDARPKQEFYDLWLSCRKHMR